MKYRYLLLFWVAIISCNKEPKKDDTNIDKIPVKDEVSLPEKEVVIQENTLIFTVQIAALENKSTKFANLPNVKIYQEEGLTKYRLGTFETYEAARDYRKKIINTYKGAFVQAIKNDAPIHIKKALN